MASKIRVAVLDDYQDFSKSIFSSLDHSTFEIAVFRDTLRPYNHVDTPTAEKDELVTRLQDFDIICKNSSHTKDARRLAGLSCTIGTMRERTPFPQELVSRLPKLRLLLTTGLRNASLDLPALKSRGVPVAGTADRARGTTNVGTDSTTQHCVALILNLARNITPDVVSVQSGSWQSGFAVGLNGKVFGTVGLGRLGAAVARIMHVAFGMRVVAWSANLTQEAADEKAKAMGLPVEAGGEKTFKAAGREELFETADVISVHLVLSDRSKGLIGGEDLRRMKKSAMFVNTSRGPLVKEGDLLAVLKDGLIRGAAVDVFDLEPLPKDSEWRTTKWGEDGKSQVLVTPHMGYVEEGTIRTWYEQQVENIKRWKDGQDLVNPLT